MNKTALSIMGVALMVVCKLATHGAFNHPAQQHGVLNEMQREMAENDGRVSAGLYDGQVFTWQMVEDGFYQSASAFDCKTPEQIQAFVALARKSYQDQRAALGKAR